MKFELILSHFSFLGYILVQNWSFQYYVLFFFILGYITVTNFRIQFQNYLIFSFLGYILVTKLVVSTLCPVFVFRILCSNEF